MKSFFLFMPFCFITAKGNSQTNAAADSLKRTLAKHPAADTTRAKILQSIIILNLFNGDEQELLAEMNEVLTISIKANWLKGQISTYNLLGIFYGFVKGQYGDALKYYFEGLKINERYGNMLYQKDLLGNIGLSLHEGGQYKKSLGYLKNAKKLGGQIGASEKSMFNINNALANTYVELKQTDSASPIYNQMIKLATDSNFLKEKGLSYCAMGTMLYRLNKYDTALAYLKKASIIGDSIPSFPQLKINALNALALTFNKTGKKNDALAAAKKALQLVQPLQSPHWEGVVWEVLAELYGDRGETAKAYNAYVKSKELKDSTAGIEKQQEMALTETNFEFEKKEAITQATHLAEIKQQQTVKKAITTGAGILLLGGIISFFFYKRKRDAVEKQKEAELKTEVSETEMKALRAQMNPHFIFNSLNSISDYMAKNNTKIADEYLIKFARLMRLILENSEQKEVSLSQDLQALELYMQLESLRMDHKFTYEINVDESIDKENTLVPPLILQPFVENSIWHGISPKEGPGKIIVRIQKEGSMINCSVEDDGIGRNEAALIETNVNPKEKKSLGMKITMERIAVLNKVKKSAASIQLSDLQQGTRAEIVLPLELSF